MVYADSALAVTLLYEEGRDQALDAGCPIHYGNKHNYHRYRCWPKTVGNPGEYLST